MLSWIHWSETHLDMIGIMIGGIGFSYILLMVLEKLSGIRDASYETPPKKQN